MSIERIGTLVLVALTAATLLIAATSVAMRAAADDVYASIEQARGSPQPRTAYAQWLSTRLAGDVPEPDLAARKARADQLSYRSDRLREAAAVPALIGLLVAVTTASPGVRGDRRDASQPAANTTSNGTA